MTLIIAAANSRFAALVPDRRLTANGKVTDEESNKAACLVLRDSRSAFAFTGLARWSNFNTRQTLLAALTDSVSPEHTIIPTIERLRVRIANDLASLPLPPEQKPLTVVFSGFLYDESGPRAFTVMLSNYEDGTQLLPCVQSDFVVDWKLERRGYDEAAACLTAVGKTDGLSQTDFESLIRLLRDARKPAQAFVNKAVNAIRAAADSGKSAGLVGKQVSSVIVPSDPSASVIEEYHSAKKTDRLHQVSSVEGRGGEFGVYIVDSPWYESRDSEDRPQTLALPKTGRNMPCPCGSGEKYKRCHGRG